MADDAVTIRTRKFMRNALLNRRQMVIDVIHPGRPNVSKTELREKIGKMFKAKDEKAVVLYGFKTAFGGNRSSGFANVYDSLEDAKKFERAYRLWRLGVIDKKDKKGRKGIKEAKNRAKKIRGTVRRYQAKKAKRNKEE